jgi:hypothetical protein
MAQHRRQRLGCIYVVVDDEYALPWNMQRPPQRPARRRPWRLGE